MIKERTIRLIQFAGNYLTIDPPEGWDPSVQSISFDDAQELMDKIFETLETIGIKVHMTYGDGDLGVYKLTNTRGE